MGGPGGGAPGRKFPIMERKSIENHDPRTMFLKGGILRHFSEVEF